MKKIVVIKKATTHAKPPGDLSGLRGLPASDQDVAALTWPAWADP